MKRRFNSEKESNPKKRRPSTSSSSSSSTNSPTPASFFCYDCWHSDCVCNETDPSLQASFFRQWLPLRNLIFASNESSWSTSSEEYSSDTLSSLGPDSDESSSQENTNSAEKTEQTD